MKILEIVSNSIVLTSATPHKWFAVQFVLRDHVTTLGCHSTE
jgi:hypothetical protein